MKHCMTISLVLAGIVLVACGGKEPPAPEPQPAAEPAPAEAPPAAEAPAEEPAEEEPTPEELPVTADFEEEAEEAIDEENYVAELTKLEKELDELEAMLAGNEPIPPSE